MRPTYLIFIDNNVDAIKRENTGRYTREPLRKNTKIFFIDDIERKTFFTHFHETSVGRSVGLPTM